MGLYVDNRYDTQSEIDLEIASKSAFSNPNEQKPIHKVPFVPMWLLKFLRRSGVGTASIDALTAKTVPRKVGSDLYLVIAFVQFIMLIFVLLFFGQITSSADITAVQDQFLNSQFSSTTLYSMIVVIFIMIFERICYIRRSLLLKIVMQVIITILLHLFCFFYAPFYSQKFLSDTSLLEMFYIFGVVYLYISSLQIYYGYVQGIVTTGYLENYSYYSYYVVFAIHMAYRYCPFLWEIRMFLDHVSSETVVTFQMWMKIEEIISFLFQNRCIMAMRNGDPEYKSRTKRDWIDKLYPFGMLALLIASVVAPIVLFSAGNPTLSVNPITQLDVTVNIHVYIIIIIINNRL